MNNRRLPDKRIREEQRYLRFLARLRRTAQNLRHRAAKKRKHDGPRSNDRDC